MTGWGHIKLYAKIAPPPPKDETLMVSLVGDMKKGSNGKYVWKDRSGNGNDCLQTGNIKPLQGGGMSVRSSSKKKDGCRIPAASTNNVDTMMTWEFTLKLHSYGGNANGRWMEVATKSCTPAWNFCPASSNGDLRFWSSKHGLVKSPTKKLALGQWAHIVIVRLKSSKKLQMYKNGVRIAEVNSPGPFEISGRDRTIMYSACGDRWTSVDLRSVRIWDSPKDAGTITKMYNEMKKKMADPGPQWRQVMQAGCKGVLTTGTYGKVGSSCWKGFTDAQINSMMDNSQMKIVWNKQKVTIYFQFAHYPDGKLKPWATDTKNNGAKWRNPGEKKWRGPCSHPAQLTHGFWFHMKTSSRTAGCAKGNFENTVGSNGFQNRDGAKFWPMTGWGHIKLYAKIAPPPPKDETLMVSLVGDMKKGSNGKYVWKDRSGNGNDCLQTGNI